MPSRITANLGSDPCDQKLKSSDRDGSILDTNNCTVIFPDSGPGNWRVDAHPTLEEARPVSQLAELLGPFVEIDAERAATYLMRRFGTLGNLMTASNETLSSVGSYEMPLAQLISAARQIVEGGIREAMGSSLVDPASPSLLRYIKMKLRQKPGEEMLAIFADSRGRYIRDENIGMGQAKSVSLHLGTLFRRALELGASRLILAHNHPSESSDPSSEDISATRQVRLIGSALDIELVDHFIVGGDKVFSMKNAGLLS